MSVGREILLKDNGRFCEPALAAVVADALGVEPRGISLRPISTGLFNTSFYVNGPARPLVLRIAPPDDPSRLLFYEYRMMRQEPRLHELIRSRTSAPVAEIVAHGLDAPGIERDFLLMERLEGAPISDHPSISSRELSNVLRQVGECLKEVHRIKGDRYGYVGPHRPMEPQADWPAAFRIMWNKLIDDVERSNGYTREQADHLRRLFDAHAKAFDRPVAASLLHMDVWAQNILAARGRLTGLVDWDRALWGDPEIEFAVLDYCGISRPAFWVGYGSPRDEGPEAEIRRIFYLLYELQKYIFIHRVRNGNAASANGYRGECLRLAAQLK